jgi:hypothetical protein
MNQKSGAARSLSAQPFTDKQGQYLAFIYTYAHMFGRPPAEADLAVSSARNKLLDETPCAYHQLYTLPRKLRPPLAGLGGTTGRFS